jgi:hypothetical protein
MLEVGWPWLVVAAYFGGMVGFGIGQIAADREWHRAKRR